MKRAKPRTVREVLDRHLGDDQSAKETSKAILADLRELLDQLRALLAGTIADEEEAA